MRVRCSRLLAIPALLAFVLAGCGQEREPINQVQPDVLDKRFFVGEDLQSAHDDPEFWAQATIVDVGYGADPSLATSSWAQKLTRIKWTIEQDFLVARLAYERIDDSDGRGLGRATNDGMVMGAWRITKHFDVQRQYNPTTGEELNVIVENATDRPWNERQFMRVDWSKNLNVSAYDFDTLSMLNLVGVEYEPLAYSITDPEHPDAPRFQVDEGYFDVTNKVLVSPNELRFSWGKIPACFLSSSPGTADYSCSATEITVRHSFRRVVDNDYEPVHWDGLKFTAAGAFTTQRKGYDPAYGPVDDRWHRFVNRYNVWERSHYYDDPESMTGPIVCATPETTPAGLSPHRDEDGDGTADECIAAGSGSRCNEFSQRCTLPYRDRQEKPIVWYYSEESDHDYWDATVVATQEWDVAMRSAVMTARYVECVRTGGDDCAETWPTLQGQQVDQEDAIWLSREVDACRNGTAWEGKDCQALARELGEARGFSRGAIALAGMQEMVVLCHSPVQADDHELCGGPRLPAGITARDCQEARLEGDRDLMAVCGKALSARVGDLRYHQVSAIAQPQIGQPWGIMVDADDPLTGEKVAASINVFTRRTGQWAQSVVDTLRYIRGEIDTTAITEGDYVRDWALAAQAASRGSLPRLTAEEVDEAVAAFAGMDPSRLKALRASGTFNSRSAREKMERSTFDLAGIRSEVGAETTSAAVYEARRQAAEGTIVEAALMTPAMQQLAGRGLGVQESMELASPLRGANPTFLREMRQKRDLVLAERGACMFDQAALAPFGFPALAEILEEKFGPFEPEAPSAQQIERAERMRQYVAQRAHYAVVLHEMGHSFGLRHNFVGSSDAFAYRPQYWQLRTANGTATTPCTDLDPTGECLGPRYFDPITENEEKNLIHMFQHSTVMDYPGEATQEFIGLGAYDFHAVRMFYADAVAVHADPTYQVRTPRGTAMLAKTDSFGGTVGFRPAIGRSDDPIATETIHYTGMQEAYGMISDCTEVDPELFRPSDWDEEKYGVWSPLLDGMLVQVGGSWTRCKQQPVDFVAWDDLRAPRTTAQVGAGEADVGFSRAGPAIDPQGRVRVPYGFASDNWADLGNLSVYRGDNGADPYELFDFLITKQEVNHIFWNYRRNRSNFSVRGAAFSTLTHYNEKLRDAAKGLALSANLTKDDALASGFEPEGYWAAVADLFFRDNVLASGLAFDHFTRQLARPEHGPHYLPTRANGMGPVEDGVYRSAEDAVGDVTSIRMLVPNGATGHFGRVTFGGRPVENSYAPDSRAGDYRTEYVLNTGSYYEKAFTAFLMTESYDNFVSDSRSDFVDARYRSVSMADVFPDGFRRWLGNNLTGDDALKGMRVVLSGTGPAVDEEGYPALGLGWVNWRDKNGPTLCFPQADSLFCEESTELTAALDPQVGWEQQKFLIAFTLWFLPENAKQQWLDQMRLWELGVDTDPGFANRIEFHDPTGKIYVARTFGREEILGKTVQKGIAARVLEWANDLLRRAYVTTEVDVDGDGIVDWYEPVLGESGQPLVRYDPAVRWVDDDGMIVPRIPGCNELENEACVCSANRACVALSRYTEVPFFLREAIDAYGHGAPRLK